MNVKCLRCFEVKPYAAFLNASDIKTKRGRNVCLICRNKQVRKWADANRDAVRINGRTHHQTINGRASFLFNAARTRARAKGDDFTLTVDHVIHGLKVGICCKTFFPFDLMTQGNGRNSPFAPSIDKIDPNGIYEPDNVQYVVWWYNAAKSDFSEELVLIMCRRIASVSP